MNIFILDNDPVLAAQQQCDKHVVKMIVESGQMLSTAHRMLDGVVERRPSKSGKTTVNYYKLLPIKKGRWVKTGTLRGVSSLVGYFQSTHHGWVRFVILLNQSAANRDRIAKLLQSNL